MPPFDEGKRISPYGLEPSAVYLDRARDSQLLADAATAPPQRRHHEALAARWLDFARRALALEHLRFEL